MISRKKDASEASLNAYNSRKKKFTLHADLHMKLLLFCDRCLTARWHLGVSFGTGVQVAGTKRIQGTGME